MSDSQEQGQTLALFGGDYENLHFQYYKFAEKKWSPLEKIGEAYLMTGAYLNEKLYYITRNEVEVQFQVFDVKTRRSTVLHSPKTILYGSSMCADDRFVYFCGEAKGDGGSTQVRKYDPQTNSFETLPPMPSKKSGTTTIVNQDFLYVLGGYDSDFDFYVEKYDFKTKLWTTLKQQLRYGFSLGILNGKLYVCGGSRDCSVDVYDPTNDRWQLVASMNKGRELGQVVVHEGKLLAIGGNAQWTVEVYDPSENRWQMHDQMSSGLKINMNFIGGIISDSCVADVY